MSFRATCDDCPWDYEDDALQDVSDKAEEHERDEFHDVSIDRVATDGGTGEGHRVITVTPGGTATSINIEEVTVRRSGAAQVVLAEGQELILSPATEWMVGPTDLVKDLEP